jgi:hypothetical protein
MWFVRISGSTSTFENVFEIQGTGAPSESCSTVENSNM